MEDPNFLSMESERLILRRFRADDAGRLASYRDDPEVARFQGWDRPYTATEATEFIAGLEDLPPGRAGTWFQFALCAKGSDHLLGDIGLLTTPENAEHGQVGYTLATAHHGKGYAGEALARVLVYAQQTLSMTRCFALVDAPNTRSRRLLDRSGFQLEYRAPDGGLLYGRSLKTP